MAVAVGISAVNALTLSPALCALILRPNEILVEGKKPEFSTRFRMAFESSFRQIVLKYKNGVKFLIKRKWLAWSAFATAVGLLFYFMNTTKTSLVPSEDTGSIFVSIDTPAGSTLAETVSIMGKVEKELQEIPQIADFNKVAGFGMGSGSGASHGMFIVQLKHWD